MKPDDFRALALRIPGAIESAHVGHPDFRLRGKIFATLGYPDREDGMVKLTPEQQQAFMTEAPRVFSPSTGAWGKGGATSVRLGLARKAPVRRALRLAAGNVTVTAKKAKRVK